MKTFGIEAIRDFEHDLDRALDDLEIAITGIAGIDEDAGDEIFIENADGSAGGDMTELAGLLDRLVEAPEAVTAAFENFGWEIGRALRTLKRATVPETAEGAPLCKGAPLCEDRP